MREHSLFFFYSLSATTSRSSIPNHIRLGTTIHR
uniref:Uncharacterized protein n=1 Tax=Podoviridae sp. ctKmJ5 TaxID=2827732 RepID=A0A8S5SYP2_9CAUD|nr:MAG TPA: hypothetical protein [Podoviridae sp. ctKmJ5]